MISKLRISRPDLDLIHGELEANSPYEACGVLVGTIEGDTAVVDKAVPITNSNRTTRSFELEPKEFYNAWNDAEKKGREIVGVFHTHPHSSAIPSQWDRETMQNEPSVWLIAGADGIKAYLWDDGVKSVGIVEI